MFLWIIALFLFFYAISGLTKSFQSKFGALNFNTQIKNSNEVIVLIQNFEDQLNSGLAPSDEQWEVLQTLKGFWKNFVYSTVIEIRESGASLLPSLKRIRLLAENLKSQGLKAKAQSAQSLMQAVVCLVLSPILSYFLYLMVPELSQFQKEWIFISVISFVICLIGFFWILKLADQASWGGISKTYRDDFVLAQVFVERLVSLIESGLASDTAWTKSVEELSESSRGLSLSYGASIWTEVSKKSYPKLLTQLGINLKKAIQYSLLEGHSSVGKLELAIEAFRIEFKTKVEEALNSLPTHSLKPLFICVAPSLLILIGSLMGMIWLSSIEEM